MRWNEPDKFLQSSDRPRKIWIEFVAKKCLTTSFPCREETQWLRPFEIDWIKINDLGSLRLWWAKRTNKSFPRVDSLVAWKPKEELRSIYERIGCLDLPRSQFFLFFPSNSNKHPNIVCCTDLAVSSESSLKLVHSWELDKYLSHRTIRSLSVQHFDSFLSLRRLQVLF